MPPPLLPGHGENRIADQLTRPVIGSRTPPVAVHHGRAQCLHIHIGEHVIVATAAAQGHHMRMLQQQQMVLRRMRVQATLQSQGVFIGDPTEPADPQSGHGAGWKYSRCGLGVQRIFRLPVACLL